MLMGSSVVLVVLTMKMVKDGDNEQNPRDCKNPPMLFGVRALASASTSGLWAWGAWGASAAVTHRNMPSLAQ